VKNKRQTNKALVSGYYEHPQDLVDAVKEIRKKELPIEDIFLPFPIHGLDELAGLKKSGIPTVGFIAGIIGAVLAFGFMTWVFTVDYPLVIGGKPYFSVPSFIPITFEVTVLFAAFAMVFGFLIKSRLGPGAKHRIYDEKITDNHFVVLLKGSSDTGIDNAKDVLSATGAMDVKIIDV
jgi:hypothetical protein